MTRPHAVHLLLWPLLAVQAAAATFGLSDYTKLTRLGDPRISPDGRTAVVVATGADYGNNAWQTELLQVDLKSGAIERLAKDRTNIRSPRWSPSGSTIAFTSATPHGQQIFLTDRRSSSEPRQLTTAPNGVIAFVWKPDGAAIAFVTPDDTPQRKKDDDAFDVGEYDYLIQTAQAPVHLWSVDITGGEPKRLTRGTWSIAVDLGMPHQWPGLVWTARGDALAFLSQPSAGSRSSYLRRIQTVAAAGGEPATMNDATKRQCGAPAFSPDAKWLSLGCPVDGQVKNLSEVVVMPAAGGDMRRDIRRVSATLDRHFSRSIWSGDSQALYIAADDGLLTGLWTVPLNGAPERWNLGKVCIAGLGQGGLGDWDIAPTGTAVFIGSEPQRPGELYTMDGPHSTPRRLTDVNAPIASLELGATEPVHWKSFEGLPLTGALTFPPHFDAAHQYPLLVLIHGGPWGAAKETFTTQSQVFAARGWIVFEPNYRGSDGEGNRLYAAFYRDLVVGPGKDIMEGLAQVKKRPYIDKARIGVSGWSVGGLLTAWLITQYQGWKAAMAGAALIELEDEFALSDVSIQSRFFSDTLATPQDIVLMHEQSPLTYASRINTPLLMLSDWSDQRVSVVQSYKLLRALQEKGKEVKLVVYPVRGHYPPDPSRIRDIDRRWMEWFAAKFK